MPSLPGLRERVERLAKGSEPVRKLRTSTLNLARVLSLAGLALALLAPPAARADLYSWVDASGNVHFTDVPGTDRARVAPAGRGGFNRVASAPKRPAGHHEVALENAGVELRVGVRLEGRLDASFVLDTGAMVNVLPASLAAELGIRIDRDTPTIEVHGLLSGARQVPLVTLHEVRVGTAVVRDVEMAVVDGAPTGLLGMPFFSRFRVQIDASRALLTLDELARAASPRAAAGANRVLHSRVPRAELSWHAVARAAGYRVEITTNASFDRVLSARASEPRLDLAGLDPRLESGTTYFWRVCALDAGGSRGQWSAVASFELP